MSRIVNALASALLLSVAFATSAAAYCTSPSPVGSYEWQVGSNLDYLLCLHNEQVSSLNSHARMLNSLGDELSTLRASQSQVTDITGYNSMLRELAASNTVVLQENAQLSLRISELEGRLDAMERVDIQPYP